MPPQEQTRKGSRISNFEWGLVIAVVAITEFIQGLLNGAAGVGVLVNRFISLVLAMSIPFYYWLRGVKADTRKVLTFAGSFLGEEIPLLDTLPFWTGDVIATMLWDKADKALSSAPKQ